MDKMAADKNITDSIYISFTDAKRLGITSGEKLVAKSNIGEKSSKVEVVANIDETLETGLSYTYLSPTNSLFSLIADGDEVADLRLETLLSQTENK